MYSDYLVRVKLAINEVAKATTESEIYRYLAEALTTHLGFNRATVRKVNWEKQTLSLECYVGFTEEVPCLKLPLSEESGALGRAALRGEGIVIFDGEETPPELRLPSALAGLQKVTRPHSFVVIPIKAKGQVEVVFEVDRKISGGGITLRDKEILDLFSETVGTALEKVFAQEELKATLIRDELTELFNRRHFMNRLSEEFARAKRYGVPLSLCIFDVDNFKLINDTYGHIFGDQVLRQIGSLTAGAVRLSDIAARYGGEEFTVLFIHTDLENAVTIAKRIHGAISTLIFPYNDKQIRVTATFGLSTYSPGNVREPKELLHYADMALYKGKKRFDKNCIVTHTQSGYKILEKEEIRFKPFPHTQEAEIIEGTADFKMSHENIIDKKDSENCSSLQIITPAISRNLRIRHQIAGSWKTLSLHLSKSSSFALLSLGIILPVIVFFAYVYDKELMIVSPPHHTSTPDNSSNELRLASIKTLPIDSENSEETLKEAAPLRYIEFEEKRISSKQQIQRISNRSRTNGEKVLSVKRGIHFRPRSTAISLIYARGKKERGVSPQIVLASDNERKKKLLAEQLRRAFLLYY